LPKRIQLKSPKYYRFASSQTRETLVDYYDGFEVLTPSAPFGGPCILLALNILEYFDIELDGLSPLDYHWMIESLAFAFSDRLALGDPRFVPMEETIATMVQLPTLSQHHHNTNTLLLVVK